MKYTISLFALLTITLFSCKKDKEDHEDFSGSITVTAPAENSTITGGNTFLVTGNIEGNTEMHGYMITVYNQNDQTVVYSNTLDSHSDVYTLNETVTHTLSVATPLRLVIEVEVDHDSESLTKEVLFQYQP
ncbi:MAG: hypothetical protein A3D31_05660 [Candidatus Fluviicola riflensis]|nr:MAG: hypothetical protein CHH17_09355 [Candidatus Fluviicola riflensis]OGS79455.1 MAG: hypothetical protein A3D31_05660 [Candidatus Fluviicola riflensis]OGS86886.1 MAG: hypothetical protein A2724_05120 [Fluviicola sp. RIFCSPHIGHO2_01_FULL_43_53]OGS89677.1 MAG: hypothetical protein A3E30_01865 [Fluviicola sp. RIFCSPHIGHO2_12_FULL_43_24]